MTQYAVNTPFQTFAGADRTPLEAGKIYIGGAGLDAQSSAISVYWDKAATLVAAQPIRTVSGAPNNEGIPTNFYVKQTYSITVTDKNNAVVFSSLNAVLGMGIGIIGGDAAISESNASAYAEAAQTSATNAQDTADGLAASVTASATAASGFADAASGYATEAEGYKNDVLNYAGQFGNITQADVITNSNSITAQATEIGDNATAITAAQTAITANATRGKPEDVTASGNIANGAFLTAKSDAGAIDLAIPRVIITLKLCVMAQIW